MNNWVLRRALLGMLTVVTETLSTMGAIIPDDADGDACTPLHRIIVDAVYQAQLTVQKLEAEINKLPHI